jgi:hypothetical protein
MKKPIVRKIRNPEIPVELVDGSKRVKLPMKV